MKRTYEAPIVTLTSLESDDIMTISLNPNIGEAASFDFEEIFAEED